MPRPRKAWLQTGDSYAFYSRGEYPRGRGSLHLIPPRGACSPATAFGVDFAFTIECATRIDTVAGLTRDCRVSGLLPRPDGVGQVRRPGGEDSAPTGSRATRPASTPSNRRMPEPNSTGEERRSRTRRSGPRSRTPGLSRRRPATRTSRSPAAARRLVEAADSMPSLTKWKVVSPRPLPRVTLLVRHDEHRCVERRVRPATSVRPRRTCALAHHARAGCARTSARTIVVVGPFLAAPPPSFRFLAEEPRREDPLLAVPSTAVPSIPRATRAAIETVPVTSTR